MRLQGVLLFLATVVASVFFWRALKRAFRDYTTLANQLDGEVVTLSNNSANLVAAIREGLLNAGAGRELIAVVKDHTDLNLTANYFRYVTT